MKFFFALLLSLVVFVAPLRAETPKYRIFALRAAFASIAGALTKAHNQPESTYLRPTPQQVGVRIGLAPADVVSVLQELPGSIETIAKDAAPFQVTGKLGPDLLSVDVQLSVQRADGSKGNVDVTVFTQYSFILSIPDPGTKGGEKLYLICPE